MKKSNKRNQGDLPTLIFLGAQARPAKA